MKKTYWFVITSVCAVAILLLLAFIIINYGKIHCTDIEVDGRQFTVSVYKLPGALRLPVVYKPGDLDKELRIYPWLKPVLFLNYGIEEYIPREEWKEYADFKWDERVYKEYIERCEMKKEQAFVLKKEYWSGVHLEMVAIVLCESDMGRALSTVITGTDAEGKRLSGAYKKLVDFDGKWKQAAFNDQGVYSRQLALCYDKAMKLVDEGKLNTNQIRKLK